MYQWVDLHLDLHISELSSEYTRCWSDGEKVDFLQELSLLYAVKNEKQNC